MIKVNFLGEQIELGLEISEYADNGRLYVGLVDEEGEFFADLTTNLYNKLVDEENGAFVCTTSDFGVNLLNIVKENNLGEVTQNMAFSGFNTYFEVIFDREKLKEHTVEYEDEEDY